ncbi:hypothetical protein M4D68_00930 [Priestia aryabhattai]|uniref:hypothetical protein n=1 Tax=Priestia aryabhattai TaxID=412384 RepID=UPI00203A74C0|nr:hypothetical protein [Priestia aryabhattai]MCM3639709.1 hypothetical protein [Priestia aryabhattai]
MTKLNYTLAELEELLAQPDYRAYTRLNYSNVPEPLLDGVRKMDNVVSFGQGIIDLFDNMVDRLGRLPSQKEYIDEGLPISQEFWEENQHTHNKINGYPWTKGVKLGVMDRLARTYTSKLVELHLEIMLKDLGYKVRTHALLDSVMGVDIVVEDDLKRYYVHVTTSKHGIAGAERSVRKKESRGNFLVKGEYKDYWVKYGRDFKGDCVLCYESTTPLHNNSTKWINNNPVFNKEYIQEYFQLRKISNRGELLDSPECKLFDFKIWAKATLKTEINI